MKTQQTRREWGKVMGYGIAIGTILGTVVGVATKNAAFVYLACF